jgi:dolichyl-phosphate beta-glucosyltransferase
MTEAGSTRLSVVIPAYNESRRLPQTLNEIRPWLDSQGYSYEVLVSDDGSRDDTVARVEGLIPGWKELRCIRWPHEGKGSTVRRGCLAAAGEYILVMDADHPTPIDTLDFMLPFIQNHDLVVGVRAFSGEEGASGRGRRIIGLIQQLLAHVIVFRKSVADSQCGFKLFSRDCVKAVFSRARVKGGMYDVELFCIAHRLNLRIYSKPVRWVNKEGSTIHIVKCMFLDPFSLFYIRMNDLLHRYD